MATWNTVDTLSPGLEAGSGEALLYLWKACSMRVETGAAGVGGRAGAARASVGDTSATTTSSVGREPES